MRAVACLERCGEAGQGEVREDHDGAFPEAREQAAAELGEAVNAGAEGRAADGQRGQQPRPRRARLPRGLGVPRARLGDGAARAAHQRQRLAAGFQGGWGGAVGGGRWWVVIGGW